MAVNGAGAGHVAVAAALAGVPVLQLSTDYVFDGTKPVPYAESDVTNPVSAYGRSKLAGESLVAAANPRHVILRTGWIYSASGSNFVRTMLRLAQTRDEVAVVADQRGCPTSADSIAAALIAISDNLLMQPDERRLYGLFHMSGQGEATWADFAEAIFAEMKERGGKQMSVRPIATANYPTPALRPANSRLDSSLLKSAHGVELPHWKTELKQMMDDII
jgi:dTDP-4-dehydrorhamnose reductase